jgi:hypothetical protein
MGLLYSSMFGEVGGMRFPIWGRQGCAALRGLGGMEKKEVGWIWSGDAAME